MIYLAFYRCKSNKIMFITLYFFMNYFSIGTTKESNTFVENTNVLDYEKIPNKWQLRQDKREQVR